jgi:hypothetical protein
VGDLRFLRTAHAHDGELDRARRVLVHAERLRHGRECRTAGLAQLERAVGVLGHEHAFDGDFLGECCAINSATRAWIRRNRSASGPPEVAMQPCADDALECRLRSR